MARESNTVVTAYWPSCSHMQHAEGRNFSLSVGQIQFFIKHNSGVRGDHIFACIHWYKKHSNYDYYGSSCIVCKTEFAADLSYCFIPIQRISSLCVHGNIELKLTDAVTEHVLVASPIH